MIHFRMLLVFATFACATTSAISWSQTLISSTLSTRVKEIHAVDTEHELWVQAEQNRIAKVAQNGDLIFQYFSGELSLVIEEVQKTKWTHVGILFQEKSGWYVYEAIGPVIKTPLRDFLRETRDRKVSVGRINLRGVDLKNPRKISELKRAFKSFEGLDYDYLFQWSNETIYCSELVYKLFFEVFRVEIGTVQRVGDLDLSGPLAQSLVDRLMEYVDPKTYLDEPIVTPTSQYSDPDLVIVHESN